MKKFRTSLSYFTIFIISAIISVYLVWNYTPLKEDIRTTLILKLRPYLGEDFLLHDFSLGLGYIAFHGVTTRNDQHTYQVNLEEIRFNYDVIQLIRYNFEPLKVLKSVTLKNPKLLLYQSGDRRISVKQDSLSTDQMVQKILANFQKIPSIDRAHVQNAQVHWELRNGKQLPVFDEMNGYLIHLNEGNIRLELVGKFYGSSSSSITFDGIVDLSNETIDADLNLNECSFSSEFPFLKNGIYIFENGLLNGQVGLHSNGFYLDSLQIFGQVNLKNLSFFIFNQHAITENCNVIFNGKNITFERFAGKLEEGEFEFEGTLENIFNPRVHWKVDVHNFPVKYLKQSHNIFEYAADGILTGQGEFHGSLDSIQVVASVSSPEILYSVVPFKNLEAELSYYRDILQFSHIRADFKEFSTKGSGEVNFETDNLKFLLNSELDVSEETFSVVDKLNSSKIIINSHIAGPFPAKRFYGTFEYFFRKADRLLIKGVGPFTLHDQFLNFMVESTNLPDPIHISGSVEHLFSNPTVKILQANDLPIEEFTSNTVVANLAKKYIVNLVMNGPYDSLFGSVNVESLDGVNHLFSLSGNIKEIFTDIQNFKGNFSALTAPLTLSGDIELSESDLGLDVKMSSPGLATGNLFIGYAEHAPIKGKLSFNRFSVSDYVANSEDVSKSLQQGYMQGELIISGTVPQPAVDFYVSADEFIVNNVGYYSTKLSGKLKENKLSFENFWVQLNNSPVFNANFWWDLKTDSLYATIDGDNIESNFIAETIFKDRNIVRGHFSYSLKASGPSKRPIISGKMEIRDGILDKNSFELLSATFRDSIPPETDLINIEEHILKIHDFVYADKKNYSVSAEGLLGIGENSPLDLIINLDGNVLAELSRLQPFFKNPQSTGHLTIRLQGSRANPIISSADLSIYEGRLEFESILPPLTNLKVEIELSENGNFVHIKGIGGTLENRWAKIYNLEKVKVGSTELNPWFFEDQELDFGTLVLETDERGIPLSIPGLMEEGDIGYFAVDGRQKGEKFYFGGPVDQPFARGKAVLYNCRVTFPFIGMGEESGEDDAVVDFLMNIDWDVLTLSGSGNRYFVEIPAYVGEAYLDLGIDNVSDGLEFSGKFNDESFRVEGSVESSRGRVEYLDVNFRVEKFGAEFSRFELYPTVYGRAYTTVRDSLGGFPRDIFLTLYAIDSETNQEISRGRWEDFRFKLVSSDPVEGETQEQVLAYLGYSVQNLPGKASEVGLTMTENYLIRPFFRPLERQIERGLGLDYVRLRSRVTSNLFYMSTQQHYNSINSPYPISYNVNTDMNPALLLFQSAEITLGKYIARDLYFTYTGQLLSGYEEANIDNARLGLYHRLGLEYRLLRNLLLEVEYDNFQLNTYYYDKSYLNDFRIRLRHSFNF